MYIITLRTRLIECSIERYTKPTQTLLCSYRAYGIINVNCTPTYAQISTVNLY